ncbi:MAG: 50S ribosomal protein L3 [Vampirovibrionales bacterium]
MSFPGFLGRKLGMTQVFDENGSAVPVTVVELLELTVSQVKTPEKDGYAAIQVGCVEAKSKHLTKAQQQHLAKNNLPLFRVLREFRLEADQVANYNVGDRVSYEFLESGVALNLTGKSIGKGTLGGIRRWGHSRGPMSHGSKSHRLPGSIGAGTTPGRVFKGLQMAGRTGNKTTTIQNLKVVRRIADKNVLLVKGSIPGCEGGLLVGKVR